MAEREGAHALTAPLSFSVVINTLNRASVLNDAISGVLALEYDAFELIVVNGPSSDQTNEVLNRWGDRIKLRTCPNANLSESRNIGIAAAAGDIVAFLDDDAVPHPQWLARLAHHYKTPDVGAVGGFTVDNTGVRWQVRKTVCDRFGTPFSVDDFFDEKALNFPGTPFYPSLLGTNSSFRRKALQQINGFDRSFAYMLDETDVCLRLVDAGWSIHYEPDALVFHQFSPSQTRTIKRIPRSTYAATVSQTYFTVRHGRLENPERQAHALTAFREGELAYFRELHSERRISRAHLHALELDLRKGSADGLARAYAAFAEGKSGGDLIQDDVAEEFRNIGGTLPLRIALVSQGFPPHNDAGIARWTQLAAEGLTALGANVHVITRSTDEPYRRFENGIWVHAISPLPDGAPIIEARYGMPASHAGWAAAVMEEIQFLKTFGVNLVSFPIWDLEALPIIDDATLPSVLSLHTSYLLALPFKPEWNVSPVHRQVVVEPMIAAERLALERAPVLLANSRAIVEELEAAYKISIAAKCQVVPHGTRDVLAEAGITLADKLAAARSRGGLRVLVPGRFELRKGYDLALRLADALRDDSAIEFHFTGADIDDGARRRAQIECSVDLFALPNASFHGVLDRASLNRQFIDADVVLMLSRFESFGLVAIEAMAAGAAVLALSAGALPEVVAHESEGWVFAENDEFLTRATAALRAAAQNPSLLAKLGGGAYDRFRSQYTVEAMAKGMLEVYQACAAQLASNQ